MTWLALILSLLMSLPAWAEDPARLDLGGSALVTTGRGWGGPQPLELRLSLTKPVPYRTFLVDGPPRLIVDLKGADLGLAHPQDMFGADNAPAIRWGHTARAGRAWSWNCPAPIASTGRVRPRARPCRRSPWPLPPSPPRTSRHVPRPRLRCATCPNRPKRPMPRRTKPSPSSLTQAMAASTPAPWPRAKARRTWSWSSRWNCVPPCRRGASMS
ncbi:AMIN domain-containing protein [Paracoccus aerius]